MEYKSHERNILRVPIKGVFLKLLSIPKSFIAISALYHGVPPILVPLTMRDFLPFPKVA